MPWVSIETIGQFEKMFVLSSVAQPEVVLAGLSGTAAAGAAGFEIIVD